MHKPLAYLLRPTSTKHIIGQAHLLQPKGLVFQMLAHNFTSSLIFYGPTGIGKTSFAIALANDLQLPYAIFNASFDKKEQLNQLLTTALTHERFIIIIDEIHRLNKDKQDILLNYMETGQIVVYCTTTENPYFVINPALRSRANILELKRIRADDAFSYIKNLIDEQHLQLSINDESLHYLCEMCNGDLRSLINALELLIKLYADQVITLPLVMELFSHAKYPSAGSGDDFHDLKSALQKSIRGSDVNAALHYFARLMAIGDFETLMRRMVIMAYEDIGLANPTLPPRVVQACGAFRQLGMPEGVIPLGLVIIEMALSQKSNSAITATQQAYQDVLHGMVYDIPPHLQDAHYRSAAKLKRGLNYKYPHDYPNGWVEQQYLPNEMQSVIYYRAKPHAAYENKLWKIYQSFTKKT